MLIIGHLQQSPAVGKRLVVRYYPNGNIREKGYQGHYANQQISTGAYVGLWKTYNERGILTKSTYYHNDIPSKAFIENKAYYPNGALRSIEKFNNYELYESGIVPIGTWSYFSPQGKLIKQIRHASTQYHD